MPPEVNAWVVVQPDDTVIIRIARVDMGQGTLTGLAQLVAEELECDWSKVTWEYPSPGRNVARNRIWQNYQTAGSQGIRQSQQYVREGGAAARMMLIQAAANEWKVPAGECVAANSVITHKPSGRTTTFGKVADAAGKLDVPKNPPLKDAKDWKIAGKPLKRLDTPDKINGKQVYAIDTKLPGMLNAAIKLCPVIGGKVKSFDAAKVETMKGVKKVAPVGDLRAWRSSPTRGGTPKPRSKRCRSFGMTVATATSRAKRSRPGSRKVSTPTRLTSATSRAMPKGRSPPPPRRSKPSTPIRIRTTRPWSR